MEEYSPPQIVSRSKHFYSARGTQKNCAIGGGSQAVSPLTHMNPAQEQDAGKTQNRNQPQKERHHEN
jgi:hypothetical protein